MFFRYIGQNGSFTHETNEVELVNFSKATNRNTRNNAKSATRTLVIRGKLLGSTQAAIRSEILDLERGYEGDGSFAALFHDDGTVSAHKLEGAKSVGGVRVLSLSFPGGADNGEYATQRTYEIRLEAEFPISGADNILSWVETLKFIGDTGPREVYVDLLEGLSQRQVVNERTTQQILQTGSAVGYLSAPAVPQPLFPQNLHHDRSSVSYGAPKRNQNLLTDWPVTWQFIHETNVPLNGRPRTPP